MFCTPKSVPSATDGRRSPLDMGILLPDNEKLGADTVAERVDVHPLTSVTVTV